MPSIDTSYRYGTQREKDLADILTKLGFEVSPSTERENIDDDIDLWLGGESVSVKAPKLKYPNLCLEYFQVTRQGTEVESWYFTSKAKHLVVIEPDNRVIVFNFARLREYMDTHPTIPFKGLTTSTKHAQRSTVHANGRLYGFIDARNKCVNIQQLLRAKVGYIL